MAQNSAARANPSFKNAVGLLGPSLVAGDVRPVAYIPWSVRVTAEHAKAVTAHGILNGIVAQRLADAYYEATTGGTVFTDDTTDATDAGTADVVPFAGTPVADDAFYIGSKYGPFMGAILIVSTAGTASDIAYDWEYLNTQGGWTALSNVNDGAAGSGDPLQTAAGSNIVTWQVPTDWAPAVISTDGISTTGGDTYLVRLRATTVTTDYTVEPIISRILVIPVAKSSYSGTATGSGATTLTDSGAAWVTDAFAGTTVTAGTSTARVLSNTGTALTVDAWVGGTPATTAAYTIYNTGLTCPATGVIRAVDVANVVATTGAGITHVQIHNLDKRTSMMISVPEQLVANVHTAQAAVANEIYFEAGDTVVFQFIGTEPASSTYDGVEYLLLIA